MQNIVLDEKVSMKKVIPIVMTISVGMLLVMMDTTIMNIAVPTLNKSFNTSLKTVQWVITGYTFALAAVIPLSGWLADRFSDKKVFFSAIALFTFASYLCSLASSIDYLILFRVIQGLSGGIVGPIGMALSWKVIPQEKRGALMGLLGLPMLIAPIAGPLLSGWLLDIASWHAVFLINIPVGLVALFLVYKFIPTSKEIQNEKLDWKGLLLAPIGFLSILNGINRLGGHSLNDALTSGLIILGVLLIIVFYFVELKSKNALMAVEAFKDGRFVRGILVSWLNQIVYFGTMLLVPLFLQTAKGYSPLHAGEMLAPLAIASFVGMVIGGKLFDRWGVRAAALPGVALMIAGIYLLTGLSVTTSLTQLISMILLLGVGQGMTMMQISTYNLSVAPKNVVTRITPMINSAMQIVNSLAVILLSNVLTKNIAQATKSLDVFNQAAFKKSIIEAYGTTFWLPLGLLVVSWLLVTTLSNKTNKVQKSQTV
ncbi:major facilitator superfamily transporter [Weissella oryzae SG25]|uniref:Major facilitator superfamily transporter n=1 Tax=Weissella oryzae (strain DSM 25784 / JCM 18191 / LMG 30913 / SG25) TaxID=1329250 RepID=A0A069CX79_WEIOS|nr:MDR family MFS transporter [Weissella oryzae]GAK31788.1 major facilitator superfamily transporter [Weissella oryzae SG25]